MDTERLTATHGQPGAAQPSRLLDRVRAAIRVCRYSPRTEEAYIAWIKRYIFFHNKRHPVEMGVEEVTGFLSSLALHGRASASTQNQAPSAALFLYKEVLQQDLPWLGGILRAKRPSRLPVVLTHSRTATTSAPSRNCWVTTMWARR